MSEVSGSGVSVRDGGPTDRRLPRPTAAGWALAGLTGTALLLGWLSTTWAVPFAAVGLALMTVSPWLAGRSLRRVRVLADARVTAVAGTRFELPLRVADASSWRGLRDLEVTVAIDDRPPGGDATRTRTGQGFVANLLPGESCVLRPVLRLAHRGRRERAEVELATTAPLGLWRRERRVEVPVELLVLPSLGTLLRPPTAVAARPGARQVGRSRRAAGDEWRELREWRPGVSLRRVHWRTSARRGRLVVREFDGQERPDVHLVLRIGDERGTDVRASDATTLREEAVSLAATVAEYCLRREHGVRISFPGSETTPTATARGARALLPILLRLAEWQPAGPRDAPVPATRSREIRVEVVVGRSGGRSGGRSDGRSSDAGAVRLAVGDAETARIWRRRRDPRRLPLGLGPGVVGRRTEQEDGA